MPVFTFQQDIRQLEKRRGGYYYFKVDAEVVEQFEKKRQTRLVCTVDGKLSYSCGLNHFGDGNYFLILATRHLKTLQKELGDTVSFEIREDPNPLGVAVPEVLQVLLGQDDLAQKRWDALTDGKKRSLIYSIQRVKDIDKQVKMSLDFLETEALRAAKKKKRGETAR